MEDTKEGRGERKIKKKGGFVAASFIHDEKTNQQMAVGRQTSAYSVVD
jgi:hypothetical protein